MYFAKHEPAAAEGARGGAPPRLQLGADALFLDFDGTLVDIAPEPSLVQPPRELPGLLSALDARLGGALALVSGRPIVEIDHHLKPARLCVAGVHGVERRAADGFVRRIPSAQLDEARALVAALCARHPALLLENKPGAIALHYRAAPELEGACLATMQTALQCTQGMALLRGKAVLELKPARASKAAAVRAFMDAAPFRLRRPWFVGDDVTDESAFEFVQAIGGIAIRVGPGETLALHRLGEPADVRAWLSEALSHARAPAAAAAATR